MTVRHRLPRFALLAALFALVALVGCTPAPADPKPTPEPKVVTPAPEPPKTDAPKPGVTDKWAGIEVGSRGVKPIVMGFTKTADGYDFTADTTFESKNTELGTLTDDNNGFDPKKVEATIAAIVELDKAIRAKHELPGERVKVVFSSGVFTRFKDKEKAAAGKALLIAAVEKALTRAPDFITEQQEAELAFRGIIAPSGRPGRLLIDIGSGNARFGWYADGAFESFTVDAGTKLVRDAITKEAADKKQPFAQAIPAVRKTLLDAPLAEKVKGAKGLDAVKDVFVIGGAAWALTTYTHPGTGDELRVPLTATNVEQFAVLTRMKPADVLAKAEGISEKAGKEVARVQKVFTPEDLQAAAEILRAFYAEAKLADRKVSYFQKGQYAWMAGYLMAAAKLPD